MRQIIFLIMFLPLITTAQFISVKTIPVTTGDQFLLFPSQNISMGEVNIALADRMHDPFVNPAQATEIERNIIFIQPTFYSISGNLGGARTFPAALFLKHNDWHAVLSLSFQQIETAKINNNTFWGWQAMDMIIPRPGPQLTSLSKDRFKDNRYAFISLAKKLNDEGWSAGGSFFWSGLNAVAGVDLLYNQSFDIKQDGHLYELRGGLSYHNESSVFEALVLFQNYKMQHDVTYLDWIWNDEIQNWQEMSRIEKNLDNTNTYGIHFAYKENLGKSDTQIGAITTYNWKTHPKIPNYEIMNIPRDPGNTHAFNFGLGLGVEKENGRFGLEFIYEPVWSNTWANAQDEIDLGNGNKILPGQKTVENDFTFNNWITRIGFNKRFGVFEINGGVKMYNYSYNLEQFDYISSSSRNQTEDWEEYTWSWGVTLNFQNFVVRYCGRLQTGAGIPSVNSWVTFDGLKNYGADIIAAPSGSLNVDYKSTYTHQFIVQIPLSEN